MLELLSNDARNALVKLIDDRIAQSIERASASAAPGSPWLTVAEAADYLRTSEAAVYKRIHRRQVPSYRPEGSRILLRRDDLDP